MEQGFQWLRDKTPEPGDFNDPVRPPAYAVLCDWNVGHWLKYRARRPVVADALGLGTEFLRQALAAKDAAALEPLLDSRAVRYLFLTRMAYPSQGALAKMYWGREPLPPGFVQRFPDPGGKADAAPPVKIIEYENLAHQKLFPE